MRKIVVFVVAALAAAAVVLVGPGSSPVDAGATTEVFAVHGLNLDGQTAQGDGGTNVTVCAGPAELIGNFQFGEVVGPVPVPTGSSLPVQVYVQDTPGTPIDCANPGAATKIIDQTIDSVPAGRVALVATAGPSSQGFELLPVTIDVECIFPGDGRLRAVHAANAGTVDLLINGGSAGPISYGESLAANFAPDTYSVQVNLAGNPILGPADITVKEATSTTVYVVGNQPGEGDTPVVAIIQETVQPVCEGPGSEAPAGVVAARPTFTG
jgi:hypothetical protein